MPAGIDQRPFDYTQISYSAIVVFMAEGQDTQSSEHKKATRKRTWRRVSQERTQQSKAWTLRELGGKTVWDWMDLLFVPVAIAVVTLLGTIGFSWYQTHIQTKIENERAEVDHQLAKQRAQDEALQAYLNQMSTLLINHELGSSGENSEVRILARARTAAVIQRLAADGNRNVIRFLNEASLTGVGQSSISLLAGADLKGSRLEGIDLSDIDLSGANLRRSNLNRANLEHTDLHEADLFLAKLNGAELEGAQLSGANMKGATLKRAANSEHANLTNANLSGADLTLANLEHATMEHSILHGAELYEAKLSDADMDSAELSDAALSNANLSGASLGGANLANAKLSGANLARADVDEVELDEADLVGIFEDDFSDKSSGWNTDNGNEIEPLRIEYANSGLRVYNPPPANTLTAYTTTFGNVEDAVVEVDATVTSKVPNDINTQWGIVCYDNDVSQTRYMLGLYSDGVPVIKKVKDGKVTVIDDKEDYPSDAIRGVKDTNHLRADCSGSRLTLDINNQEVIDAPVDKEIKASGGIGLFVQERGKEAIGISFDNFVVKGPRPSFD